VAWAAETIAHITGREPVVTADALRMASKFMYYSSDKAREKLGYEPRPAQEALTDAVDWFRNNGFLD
jgi:dihydroflavonol-4-reductase